jgi:predicted membrane channel-forming protein YqfA (hemolysin III family)
MDKAGRWTLLVIVILGMVDGAMTAYLVPRYGWLSPQLWLFMAASILIPLPLLVWRAKRDRGQ